MQKQVVFFGSSPLSNIVLQKLIDAKMVSSVVTKADKPVGRHLELTPNLVKVLAQKYNIPVDTTTQGGAVALVAAYGSIIKPEVLNSFAGEIYNIHPSLLPKYRGASPLQSQILDGVIDTGVTIIKLDAEMDHGPIVAQSTSKILSTETWLTLGERLFAEGADLFLSSDLNDEKAQDHSQATYTRKIARRDGFVSWEEFKPENLETKFRAYANWPGVWTTTPDGKRLKLIALNPEVLVQVEGKSPEVFKAYLAHR